MTPTANDYLKFLTRLFVEQTWFLSDTLNGGIDDVSVDLETVAATTDLQIFDTVLKAGPRPVSGGPSEAIATVRR